MMGKKLIGIILLICLLTGCDPNENPVNSAQDSPRYVEGEDYQQLNEMGSSSAWRFTKGADGYYYFDEMNSLICYYDLAAKTAIPLCNQPDCDHMNESCNAYIPFKFYLDFMQYYDGNLYVFGADSDASKDVCIYRISADGTTRENLCALFSLEGNASYSCAVHRGYAYYALNHGGLEQSEVNVYRVKLIPGASPELLYTTAKQAGGEVELRAYGNYLYMRYSHYADSSGNGYTGELYRWQIHDGNVELILNDIWRGFAVDADCVYYDNGTQIMAYDLESGAESVLAETGMPVYMAYSDGYLYYDNGCGLWLSDADDSARAITVIDAAAASVVGSIPLPGEHSEFIGADGVNVIAMIVQKTGAGNKMGFNICSIEDIRSGTAQWRALQ